MKKDKSLERALDTKAIINEDTKNKIIEAINRNRRHICEYYVNEPVIYENNCKIPLKIGDKICVKDNNVKSFWTVKDIKKADLDNDDKYNITLEEFYLEDK